MFPTASAMKRYSATENGLAAEPTKYTAFTQLQISFPPQNPEQCCEDSEWFWNTLAWCNVNLLSSWRNLISYEKSTDWLNFSAAENHPMVIFIALLLLWLTKFCFHIGALYKAVTGMNFTSCLVVRLLSFIPFHSLKAFFCMRLANQDRISYWY